MVPDNGYVVLTESEYTDLMSALTNLGIVLPFAFAYDDKNHVYYVADSDEIYDFFWDNELADYYEGGWYLLSTKWVNGL